jgi:hypothetical protein
MKPNERIVGIFSSESDEKYSPGWGLKYKTLTTTPKTILLRANIMLVDVKPLGIPKSKVYNAKNREQKGLALQTAAMAKNIFWSWY